MHWCGIMPSPAISFDVSTTMTFLVSARQRVASRIIVVLPEPGSPRTRMDLSLPRRRSIIISAFPVVVVRFRLAGSVGTTQVIVRSVRGESVWSESKCV